jgi:protocatechuate 3,4-dioxygenase beta subunit
MQVAIMTPRAFEPDRRRLLRLFVAAPFVSVFAAELMIADEAEAADALYAATASGRNQTPTPECGDDDEPTPAETAGPFFKPRSPERASLLENGLHGTRLELTGRVYGRNCRPLAGALLDFWHADDSGVYDNDGFRLRGHQLTDAQGRYHLTTILPGAYSGRTRHIHVRVQPGVPGGSAAGSGRVLTTQLYFPGEKRNRDDGLFKGELLMSLDASASPQQGRFHFLLDV